MFALSASFGATPTVLLNSGVKMPVVIYGTGGAHTQDNVTGTAIATGLALSAAVGFAGIDGANHYHNQIGVRGARRKALGIAHLLRRHGRHLERIFWC